MEFSRNEAEWNFLISSVVKFSHDEAEWNFLLPNEILSYHPVPSFVDGNYPPIKYRESIVTICTNTNVSMATTEFRSTTLLYHELLVYVLLVTSLVLHEVYTGTHVLYTGVCVCVHEKLKNYNYFRYNTCCLRVCVCVREAEELHLFQAQILQNVLAGIEKQ